MKLDPRVRKLPIALFLVLLWHPLSATTPERDRCLAYRYKVLPLPLRPAAINSRQQIVGTTSAYRAALWTESKGVVPLPLPDGYTSSEAVAINDAGQILFMAFDRERKNRTALLFEHGKLFELPGTQARAYSLSPSGVIAGESMVSDRAKMQPAIWRKHELQTLENCCGGSAKDINDLGQVVGDFYDDQGRYHAALWSGPAALQSIGPPDQYSSSIAINAVGHVIIQGLPRSFLYVDGQLQSLSLAPRYPSQVRAINSCDTIVGSFGPFSDANRAFRWTASSGFEDLNSLIPAGSGWKLESAVGINERGDIIGNGDLPRTDNSGFLLTPVR